MLKVDDFNNLKVGDVIEGEQLFSKLSDEPVLLTTVFKKKTRAEFVVSYMEVTLGRWVCLLVGDKLQWQT